MSDLTLVTPPEFPGDIPKGFVLLINKPLGWTSFDVVNKVRYWLGKRMNVKRPKVGHAGTLDPLATGLLILCVGEYTRRIEDLQGMEKEYTGTLTFGAVTASYDLEKPVEVIPEPDVLTPESIEAARLSMIGDIEQYPPIFSAVKVDGKRLYSIARKGKDVDLQPRKVNISTFELSPLHPVDPAEMRSEVRALSQKGSPIWQHPDYADGQQSDFRIVCGKGTYIRSMAFDMGDRTGNGAYLSTLCRTRIGPFLLENAWEVEDLIEKIKGE